MSNTVYYFSVRSQSFEEALGIFSEFFISPLLSKKYIDKEMHAVDSEFSKNINNDVWRGQNLFRTTSNSKSVFNVFSTGNLETLKVPDIHSRVSAFYQETYRLVQNF